MQEPLILVDVYNIVFRSHFAFQGLSWEGKPTGGIYGLLKAVLNLRDVSPRLVFCWDHGVPGCEDKPYWRKAICPTYKEKRKQDDKDKAAVKEYLPILRDCIEWLGYTNVGLPGYEADDCIGWISRQEKGMVFLHSTDEDLYQLLKKNVRVLKPGKADKGRYPVITETMVEAEYEIPIERWVDYLAMGADTADNYTVKGMGPGVAKKLVWAGADPSIPFSDQHEEVQKKFSRWAPSWGQVMIAHQVAKIPDKCELKSFPNGHPRKDGKDARLKRFGAFCGDFGMVEFYGKRKLFFE